MANLTTKNVLGKKAPKAAPKKTAARPAPKPDRSSGGPVVPGESYVVGERGPEIFMAGPDGATVTPLQQADHHLIPDRDYTKSRPHDEARGCWCFPEIEGNEVRHR